MSPTLAICGEVNTALGTKRWSVRRQVVGVQQVVLHGAGLVVGDVLEVASGCATSPSAQTPSTEVRWMLVDHDDAVVDLDRGVLQAEPVGVGDPAGGDQQHVGLDLGAVGEGEHDVRRRARAPWSTAVPSRTSHCRGGDLR